jgi:hypothetical protein
MFLACFRYLSDSDRSDEERSDIPAHPIDVQYSPHCLVHFVTASRTTEETERDVKRGVTTKLTIERIPPPKQILHILRHDPRHILQILIDLPQVALSSWWWRIRGGGFGDEARGGGGGLRSGTRIFVLSGAAGHECICTREIDGSVRMKSDMEFGWSGQQLSRSVSLPWGEDDGRESDGIPILLELAHPSLDLFIVPRAHLAGIGPSIGHPPLSC